MVFMNNCSCQVRVQVCQCVLVLMDNKGSQETFLVVCAVLCNCDGKPGYCVLTTDGSMCVLATGGYVPFFKGGVSVRW